MGASYHELLTSTDSQAQAKEDIDAEQDSARPSGDDDDGYPGSFYGIEGFKFTDKEFDSHDKASDYISKNTGKWDEGLVVKVKAKQKNSKGIQKKRAVIMEKYSECKLKVRELRVKKEKKLIELVKMWKNNTKDGALKPLHYKCKDCNSSVNSKYMSGQHRKNYGKLYWKYECPVCEEEVPEKETDKEIKKQLLVCNKLNEKLKQSTPSFFWLAGGWSAC